MPYNALRKIYQGTKGAVPCRFRPIYIYLEVNGIVLLWSVEHNGPGPCLIGDHYLLVLCTRTCFPISTASTSFVSCLQFLHCGTVLLCCLTLHMAKISECITLVDDPQLNLNGPLCHSPVYICKHTAGQITCYIGACLWVM